MRYPALIHKDTHSDYGVSVPDLPGCFSAGETIEEAVAMAREAIELHLEGMLEDDADIPLPSDIQSLQVTLADAENGTWALVEVDTDALMGPAERINITIPRHALRKIDAAAQQSGLNRSQFLTQSGLAKASMASSKSPQGPRSGFISSAPLK